MCSFTLNTSAAWFTLFLLVLLFLSVSVLFVIFRGKQVWWRCVFSVQDEDTEALLAADFEIGHFIRERIVPRAVLYFTGEALENDDVSVWLWCFVVGPPISELEGKLLESLCPPVCPGLFQKMSSASVNLLVARLVAAWAGPVAGTLIL